MPEASSDRYAIPPRGRLAPSPTGNLHLGNAFSFLLAWLSMAAQKGTLVLRVEDIDPDRSRPEFTRGILEDLAWLGIFWDEGPVLSDNASTFPQARSIAASPYSDLPGTAHGTDSAAFSQGERGIHGPYVQSLRRGRYEAALEGLLAHGLVYPCFCTRKELRLLASAPHIGDEGVPYPGTCRDLSKKEQSVRIREGKRFSLRLNTARAMTFALAAEQERCGSKGQKTEESLLSFEDAVLGPQHFSMADCGGDFALRRSDGVFAYQLAVTVDDAAMGITEVVRGEDLLLSTPRQILLLRLFGAQPPRYAHVPLVHDSQVERLAKRHKSLELRALREAGVAPEAIIGYLGFLAGFLETPRPMPARDLIPLFSFSRLAGQRPVAREEDIRLFLKTPAT